MQNTLNQHFVSPQVASLVEILYVGYSPGSLSHTLCGSFESSSAEIRTIFEDGLGLASLNTVERAIPIVLQLRSLYTHDYTQSEQFLAAKV